MFGFLNVNKAKYRTSREVVNQVVRSVKPEKVGHAGTLDPLATGVLVICVGPATRLAQHVQRMPKNYLADFRLGLDSDTEDILGKVVDLKDPPEVSADQLTAVLPEFCGAILQLPPKFSALKVKGQRAYDLARQGKNVDLQPRPIEIHEIELVHFSYPNFQIKIRCGSGTYVRSLGRDIARRVGSRAVMTGLVRTAIGNFRLADAIPSEDLDLDSVQNHILKPQAYLDTLPGILFPAEQIERFAHAHSWTPETVRQEEEIMAHDSQGRLLAIMKRRDDGSYSPNTNFANYWLRVSKQDEASQNETNTARK